jgi:hypothetical protein
MTRIAHPCATTSALALAVALTLGAGIGTAWASPETGGRNIQDFATASFRTWISECYFVDASVQYFAGDNLQSPIGSGKPTHWADAPTRVGVFDACDNDNEVWHVEGLGFPDSGPAFDRLDSASLDVSLVTLFDGVGTSVDAEIHLDWLGQGPTTARVDHQLDVGYYRQERFRSASVTGTVEFGASLFWSSLTLTGDQSHDAIIGTANEITLP